MSLESALDEIAADVRFSGVIRVDREGAPAVSRGYGMARRDLGIPNGPDTLFGIASGTKSFTALTVMSLVESGELTLDTTARPLLGNDLPLVDDAVTVHHLLRHRSGIGDYLDEEQVSDLNEYTLAVSPHRLATTEDYLVVLGGQKQKFTPGERFAYSNSGYVVLALLAERATGVVFQDLVMERVCRPAGLTDTAFLRSDELPGRAALGYLDPGLSTNVLHLPVRGSGDGGLSTTAADLAALWRALRAGAIVSTEAVAEMTRAHSDAPVESMQYGAGFWLDVDKDRVLAMGGDPGVGFLSWSQANSGISASVLCNQTSGAWPTAQRLFELLG